MSSSLVTSSSSSNPSRFLISFGELFSNCIDSLVVTLGASPSLSACFFFLCFFDFFFSFGLDSGTSGGLLGEKGVALFGAFLNGTSGASAGLFGVLGLGASFPLLNGTSGASEVPVGEKGLGDSFLSGKKIASSPGDTSEDLKGLLLGGTGGGEEEDVSLLMILGAWMVKV